MADKPYRYLLDTNILSDLIRNPGGVIAMRLAELEEDEACTSIVVVSELRFGAAKKSSVRLTARVEQVIKVMDVLPLASPIDSHYAEIRTHLSRIGQPIGHNDFFIAAHARALGLTLVTDNLGEFERVPGLKIENWLNAKES
jgi:tRNA(fMet)-specific endonuclease VapC